jgi:DNA-binding MarR family transcriptional regulator
MMTTKHEANTQLEAPDAARLQLATMRLARRLRQQAPEGTTPSQLSALSTLARLGPLTIGELAAHERVQPPTITRLVGMLEVAGLIDRERDPQDGRLQRVSLSKKGRILVERSRTRKTAYLVKMSRKLSGAEIEELRVLTELLERLVEDDD